MPSALKYASILSRRNGPMSSEFHIAGGVALFGIGGQQVLTGAFGDGDYSVRLGEHPLFQGREKCSSSKGTSGNEREVHVLACDSRASSDEASVPAHEFHEPDPAGHAARFRVRAIEDARGFFDRAEEPERTRDEPNVVIDGLWNADDRERVSAPARFLVEIVGAALRAIATNGEKNVHPTRD